MKITNKSELMSAAWKMFRNVKNNIATFSEALKIAWAIYKEYLESKKELNTEQKELYKAMMWANNKVSRYSFDTNFKRFEETYNKCKEDFASIWKFAAAYARSKDKEYRAHA